VDVRHLNFNHKAGKQHNAKRRETKSPERKADSGTVKKHLTLIPYNPKGTTLELSTEHCYVLHWPFIGNMVRLSLT